MTPWVTRLVFLNAGMFLASMALPVLIPLLMLVPALIPVRPWSIVTYMFLHADLWHLAFNMLGLFFLGPRLEARLGSRRFLALYFTSGIAGALLSLFTPHAAIIGASGAVFGVFIGFAMYWPREKVFIWGVLPVEARVLVVAMTALSIWGGWSGGGGIAHLAHLGGFLGGFLYLRWLERFSPAARAARAFREKAQPELKSATDRDMDRWRLIRPEEMHPLNRAEFERVMRKIADEGASRLTPSERAFLDRFSSA